MSWLGDLLVRLKAETADFQQDLGKAAYVADKSMKQIERAGNSMAAKLGVAISAAGFTAWVKGSIDAADQMGKLAQRAGENVTTFSSMAAAFKQDGIDAETLQVAMRGLDKQIALASAGAKTSQSLFTALGISYRDASGNVRRASDVMLDLAKVFAGAKDDPVKTAYALELMGKAGDQMIVPLNQGKEAILELMRKAQEAGKVVGPEFAEQANQFNNNLDELKSSATVLGMSLAKDLLPHLKNITDEFIRGRQESGFWAGAMAGWGRYVFEVFDGVSDPVQRAGRDVVKLNDDIDRLDKALARIKKDPWSAGDHERPGVLEEQIRQKRAEMESARKFFALVEQGSKPDKPPKPPKPKRGLPAFGLKDGTAEIERETRLYTSALQQLEEKLGKSNSLSEEQIVLNRVTAGSWKDLTLEHKDNLLVVAREIDQKAQLIQRIEAEYDSRKQLIEQYQQIEQVQNQAFTTAAREREDMAFELTLIGKTAYELQRLTAARQAELQTRQNIEALIAAQTEDPDPDEFNKIMADAEAAGERQKQVILDGLAARRGAERDWMTGARSAFDDYIDAATDAAAQASRLFGNAFRSMEDALVAFAKTGKLDFRSLADSIITDIIRIQVQQSIVKPLSAMLEQNGAGFMRGVGSLFGFGSGVPIPGGIEPMAMGMEFAQGGRFTVGGHGGTDSQAVRFRATPGEEVEVTPPGRQPAASGNNIDIRISVTTPDARGMRASAGQLGAAVATQMSRALRRYN